MTVKSGHAVPCGHGTLDCTVAVHCTVLSRYTAHAVGQVCVLTLTDACRLIANRRDNSGEYSVYRVVPWQ